MSLLDDVSIVVTPNGYKAGELYAVVPVPVEGSELVTNGDFATDTDWTKGAGWTISGGTANCDGTSNSTLHQDISGVENTRYIITLTVSSYTSGTLQIGGSTNNLEVNSNGTFIHYRTWTNDSILYLKSKSGDGFNGSIDNVSVKEYTAADMDVTRATAATRVDEAGLVNYAEIIGGEEVTDGDFSQEGAEKVTNGDFSADSNWNQVGSNGWSIDTGTSTLNFTNASSYVFQGISTVSGKSYKVTLDIELNSGTIVAKSFSAQDVLTVTSTGRQTVTGYFTEIDSNANFGFVASGSASGKIHSVSVKEVGADWTISGAWSLGTNKVIFSDTTNGDIRTSSAIFTATKTYQIKLTVADLTGANTAFFAIGDGNASNLVGYDNYANGEYTFNAIAPSGLELRIFSTTSSGSSYSITNISVKEVTRDNVPRIDYSGGGCPHILAEPQSTNHCTFSEQPSVWTSSTGVTVTANATTSPEGTANASTVVNTATNAFVRNAFLYTSTDASLNVTTSFFLKYTNNQWVYLKPNFFTGGSNSKTWFDIQNGVLGTNDNVSSSIVDFGNGWYRCSVTHQIAPATDASGFVFIYAVDNDNSETQVVGQGFAAFGSQGEELSYSTSYIPTSGSTVTRNQDQFTRDGIGSLINSAEGVLFLEMAALSDDTSIRLIGLNNGSDSDRVYFYFRNSSLSNPNRVRTEIISGSSVQYGAYHNIPDSGSVLDFNKMAIKWKENDISVYINGNNVYSSTGTAAAPVGLNSLDFSTAAGSIPFYGKVKQLQVYKTALTDAQLTSLTS